MANIQEKHLSGANSLTGVHGIQEITGAGGLFSTPGLENAMISTVPVPKQGFAELLPAVPSNQLVSEYPVFTGITDPDLSSLPDTTCEPAPTPGLLKGATLRGSYFGQITMDTNEINATELAMTIAGVGGPFDLMGYTTALPGGNLLYPGSTENAGDIINNLAEAEMHKVGLSAWRTTSQWVWSGVPASTGKKAFKPFAGLDTMIVTGQVDAQTNTAVPELDPTIVNYAYRDVALPSSDIVGLLQELEAYLFHRAENELMGASWVLVMRPEMWYEITKVWPALYSTQDVDELIASGSAINVNINADTLLQMRYAMRNNQVLEINGRPYTVILDNTIPELNSTNNANLAPAHYASTIYWLPVQVANGYQALYWEYFDFSKSLDLVRSMFGGAGDFFWTDGGRFAWAVSQEEFCFKLKFTGMMRLVSRVPQLAARITNVMYERGRKDRDPYPSWPYGAQGGVSLRNTPPTRYSVF